MKMEMDVKKLEEPEPKKSKFGSKVMLFVLVLVIIAGAAYHFIGWQADTESAVAPTRLLMTGILYSDENPAAIVENKIVHEGDIVDSVRIVKIHKDKVEFEKDSCRWSQQAEMLKPGGQQ